MFISTVLVSTRNIPVYENEESVLLDPYLTT